VRRVGSYIATPRKLSCVEIVSRGPKPSRVYTTRAVVAYQIQKWIFEILAPKGGH
jgi:hypothetical protein